VAMIFVQGSAVNDEGVDSDIEEGVCGSDRSALNVARDLERQVACLCSQSNRAHYNYRCSALINVSIV
jgi:hypothetical protein